MSSFLSVFVLGLASLAAAQSASQSDYPYTINPDSVPSSDRDYWCQNQIAQCPLICLQQPGVTSMDTVSNDCDPDNLTYSCVCENNVSPNITQFSQTLPYYICSAWGDQCVSNCNGNNACANDCRADHPCGAQHPNPPNASITASPSATNSGAAKTSIPVTGFGGSQPTDSASHSKGAASSMYNLGQSYGMAVVFASVFAGFALML